MPQAGVCVWDLGGYTMSHHQNLPQRSLGCDAPDLVRLLQLLAARCAALIS